MQRRKRAEGGPVGVGLQRLLTGRPRDGGGALLLDDVRQLVREQCVADQRAGRVLAGCERHVRAGGHGAGTRRGGEPTGGGVVMDAHLREVRGQGRAHPLAHRRLERPTGTEVAHQPIDCGVAGAPLERMDHGAPLLVGAGRGHAGVDRRAQERSELTRSGDAVRGRGRVDRVGWRAVRRR